VLPESSGLGSAKGRLAVLIETMHPEKCERLVHYSRLGDFQVQSGEVIRDARLVWKRPCPASFADRSCMESARRYPDAAFLKASVRRWLE
jgi:hypothetical protein